MRVFCKTTGTDPMTINVAGVEEPLRRRGKANIKEQVGILRRAAAENAQVLVIECMALQPEYQRCAQHRILQADVGVITNVRHDHADVMGATLPEIADTLCNTVPQNGILFTADEAMAPRLQAYAEKMHSRFTLARPNGSEPDFDFAENIALALAVCQQLGVARQTALQGMAHYKRDPYALALYTAGNGIFVNAVSVNDPDYLYRVAAAAGKAGGQGRASGADRVQPCRPRQPHPGYAYGVYPPGPGGDLAGGLAQKLYEGPAASPAARVLRAQLCACRPDAPGANAQGHGAAGSGESVRRRARADRPGA